MALELFNTLSGKVETFQPLEENEVRMYACGPTVYDYGHVGNFRTFIVVDTLRRFLKQSGYKLKHVMNITDVDDKIIRNAARDGKTVGEYTAKYKKAFLEDSDALNIEHPETTSTRWRRSSSGWWNRTLRTKPRMGRITFASRSFRSTASFQKKILKA
jgi:cysteinyl-tRNA synthetase